MKFPPLKDCSSMRVFLKVLTLSIFFCSLLVYPCRAFSNLSQVVGEREYGLAQDGETLMEIARKHGLGYENLRNANPGLDPWHLSPGTEILLPRQVILPSGIKPGLTVNLAEMRLFHMYPGDDGPRVEIYPLGIGRTGRETPEGAFRVVSRQVAPVWRVPAGLRDLDPTLPELVPPGPDNPLGNYWLGISAPGYGIHGTNRPLGVGRRISYGCLRMYPEDIAALFPRIPIGSPVQITYQPIKAGWLEEELMLEVHPDYLERFPDNFQAALTAISEQLGGTEVEYGKVRAAVESARGIPVNIGKQIPISADEQKGRK